MCTSCTSERGAALFLPQPAPALVASICARIRANVQANGPSRTLGPWIRSHAALGRDTVGVLLWVPKTAGVLLWISNTAGVLLWFPNTAGVLLWVPYTAGVLLWVSNTFSVVLWALTVCTLLCVSPLHISFSKAQPACPACLPPIGQPACHFPAPPGLRWRSAPLAQPPCAFWLRTWKRSDRCRVSGSNCLVTR